MKKKIPISVFEIVGSPICVASSDGQKVFERIAKALRQKRRVSLSFLNVSILTSAFLNSAIGQLYGEFEESEIRDFLSVDSIEERDVILLSRVVQTAKLFFADPEKLSRDVQEELGIGDDEE